MGCCNGSSWKREEKKDHRFDYLEIHDFHSNSFSCRVGYFYVFIAAFRSFAVLGLDIYTAVGLLILKSYKSTVTQQTFIAHDITKWIFAGCIILSVVLLIWDWIVAIRIIRSRNISFAYTNVIANRYYSIKSYDYHCLFHRLESSSQKTNVVVFWVYFSFQGCMRLLFSEGPRQAINALTVFSVLSTRNFSFDKESYADITPFQWTVLGFMGLSLLIWLFSFVRFCMAALLFPFLLCYIQGGLTEFVVRKIDRRIQNIIEKTRRKRLERYAVARRAEDNASLYGSKKSSHSKSKSIVTEKPTLPTIPLLPSDKASLLTSSRALDSDNDSLFSEHSMSKSASTYNLSAYPLPRSETLPLYRTRTQENLAIDRQGQEQPSLPNLMPDSPPRLSNQSNSYRPAPGMTSRPSMQSVPSYHRQASFGAATRDPAPLYADDGAYRQRQPSRGVPTRVLTNPTADNQLGIRSSTSSQSLQSNLSLHSQRTNQTTQSRPQQRPLRPSDQFNRSRPQL